MSESSQEGTVDVMASWWCRQEPGKKEEFSITEEVGRLLDDLDYIRNNTGSVGPDHPRALKWITEVRACLSRGGNKSGLKAFERLELVKCGGGMWRRQDITEADIPRYRADLRKAEAILKNMEEPPDQSSVDERLSDERLREFFMNPDQENTEKQTPQEARGETAAETGYEADTEIAKRTAVMEKTTHEKIEPEEDVTEQHPTLLNSERTVDQLIEELGAEMKSLDPDWEKIQQVMGALLALRRTDELVERLRAQARNPEVKWEPIRKLMLQLWSIKKDLLVELLPSLLGR